MTPLDILLCLLLAYSALRAAINGFIRELFTLLGLLLGFPLACAFYHPGALALAGLITSPPLAALVAFLLIMASVAMTASLLGRVFRRGARTVGLGVMDRVGGALFGLLRGATIGAAFLVAITAFLPTAAWVQNSLLAPYLLRAAHAVSFLMPSDIEAKLWETLKHLKHSSPGWIKPGLSSHTVVRVQF